MGRMEHAVTPQVDYNAFAAGYRAAVVERTGGGLVGNAEIRAAYGRWLIEDAARAARCVASARRGNAQATPAMLAARLSPAQRRALAVLADGAAHATGPATAEGFVQGNAARGLVRLGCATATAGKVTAYKITQVGSAVWQELGPEGSHNSPRCTCRGKNAHDGGPCDRYGR